MLLERIHSSTNNDGGGGGWQSLHFWLGLLLSQRLGRDIGSGFFNEKLNALSYVLMAWRTQMIYFPPYYNGQLLYRMIWSTFINNPIILLLLHVSIVKAMLWIWIRIGSGLKWGQQILQTLLVGIRILILTWSRIHERTISMRFLGFLRVLRLEVSVWIS